MKEIQRNNSYPVTTKTCDATENQNSKIQKKTHCMPLARLSQSEAGRETEFPRPLFSAFVLKLLIKKN